MRTTLISLLAALLFSASAQTFFNDNPRHYKDVPRYHWASDAIDALTQAGVFLGNPDGTFQGNTSVNRYELAAILHRLQTHLGLAGSEEPDEMSLEATRTRMVELENIQKDLYMLLGEVVNTSTLEMESLYGRIDQLEGQVVTLVAFTENYYAAQARETPLQTKAEAQPVLLNAPAATVSTPRPVVVAAAQPSPLPLPKAQPKAVSSATEQNAPAVIHLTPETHRNWEALRDTGNSFTVIY